MLFLVLFLLRVFALILFFFLLFILIAVRYKAALLKLLNIRLKLLIAVELTLLHSVGASLDAETADIAAFQVLKSFIDVLALVLQLDDRQWGLLRSANFLCVLRRRVVELVLEARADVTVQVVLLSEERVLILLLLLNLRHLDFLVEHAAQEALLLFLLVGFHTGLL
jgi:hypothetical protein